MFGKNLSRSLVFTVVATLVMSATTVFADDISNNLDGSIDAVAEVMPLTVGGAAGTTQLYVIERNGDGKNGCNLTGSTTLVVSVASSNNAAATVSPSSVTFNSCGFIATLTVSAVAAGSATISVSQTSNSTAGTFNLAPATFTVNVTAPPPANTAPSLSISGVTAGGSYNKGSVPVAMCDVVDAEDGDSSFPAALSAITGIYASDGIGSQTASCDYTDAGGLTASASATYSIVDPSAPVIDYLLSPASPDGSNGWYNGNVTLTWTVTEDESPNSLVKTGCVDQNITADQPETPYSCSASSAGGSAGPVSVSIKRDGTAPSVAYTSASGTPGDNGWYTSAVTATFTATDLLSGFGAGPSTTTTDTKSSASEGSGVLINSPAFADNAGNTAAVGTASQSFDIDLTNPLVDITSPTDGSSTIATSVTVSGTASDSPSGLASVVVNGVTATGAFSASPVPLDCGANTITATATDLAGRTSSDSISVERICFSGLHFYQPLDQSTGSTVMINAGKYGRVIPVKVTASVFGAPLTDSVLQTNGWTLQIGVNGVNCSGGAATDAVEAYADAGASAAGTNLFRWDSAAQQWIYNLDTKAPPGVSMTINQCYRLDVYISDGTNKVKISTTTYAVFKPTK